jgi:hypothetical protein
VSTQQQQVSAAILAKDHRSQPALRLLDPVGSPIETLQARVGEVMTALETPPADEPLGAVVARCNAALEDFLERAREHAAQDSADPVASRDELRRLLRLLGEVDRADAPMVVRAIRRVVARFDGDGVM